MAKATGELHLGVDVLVVGAGGCGLTLCSLLADMRVDFVTLERNTELSQLPKAHYLNQRTMEIFRQHSIASDIYAEGTPPANMQRAMWLTTLGGDGPYDRKIIHEMDGIGGTGPSQRAVYERDSACPSANLPLIRSEPILKRHADSRAPGRLLLGHEVTRLEQDDEGVTVWARQRDSNLENTWRAKYVVAADGGRTIGKALGNKMVGPTGLAKNVTVHFEADLSNDLLDDRVMLHFFMHPTRRGPLASGALVPAGPGRWGRHSPEWIFHFMVAPDDPSRFDEAMVTQQIRDLLKLPQLPIKVLKISHWMIEAVLAESYRYGRVFLCGDAAHRHPPASGLGLNTGIQDAHNLAWKLALVTRGAATDHLLDSYEMERRPIGAINVSWALSSYWNHLLSAASIFAIHPSNVYEVTGKPDAEDEFAGLFADTADGRMRRARVKDVFNTHRVEMFDHDVELGFVYETGALCPDGSAAPERDPWGSDYRPTTRPGHRLPHAWLEVGGTRVSTLDLVGPSADFLLLANPQAQGWVAEAKELSQKFGITIRIVRVAPDGDALDTYGAWGRLCQLDTDGAVLVRPDGFIAWRSQRVRSEGPQRMERRVMRALRLV